MEQLIAAVPFTCTHCGAPEQANYTEPTRRRLIETQRCFLCDFWAEKVMQATHPYHGPRCVRVGGRHYYILDDNPKARPRELGHGGSLFTVLFNDGRTVTTRNLYGQGQIPDEWRDQLPDNARFAKGA